MKAVLEVLNLIKKDKYIKYSVIIILFLCIVHSLILGYASGLIVLLWYILGYAISFILIEYQPYVVAYLEKLVSVYNNRSSIREKIKSSCSVCDDLTCKRHQITKDLRPWKIIQISDELNEAIIHFYERILNTFVSSWYNQFTDSKDFPNELRFCLKYASATLINRFFQIDYINVITNKLVPQAIKHIDDYLYMQQIAKLKNVKFNDVVVEYLGKKLHPAITNRKNELEYLQHLSSELIKQLLPEHYIKCKNYSVLLREILAGWVLLPLMDVLADPNIINHLVIIATNYRPGKSSKVLSTANNVEFLENFIAVDDNSTSSLAINLNKIKNNVELLYAFMQFLKKEEQVHILQFCLDVDDFNTKLLTPDLTKKQLEDLHSQAISLYKEYLSEDSISFIGCSKEICDQFNGLIKDIYSVAQLRTSKPLYQAYEYAFNYLESIWLPHFFHSNEFYNYICGSKVSATYHKASIKSKKYYEQSNYSAVSKISSSFGKIKGVLKTQIPVEGSLDSLEAIENGISEDLILNENLIRDLSSWRVTIPTSEVTPNKVTYFCLNVLHVDNSTPDHKINNWIVWRKDQDFFTLKSKLVEFHGEDEICDSPLPSRKAGSAIESRMAKYEDFIMKLLQKPSLRGSDLLHTFLTHDEDFTLVISTLAATNQDIGNIYQSVAYKLRKEKGQHLDSFMATFFNSIAKQKPDKIDLAEEGLEMHSGINQVTPKTFHSNIFKDNFGVSYRQCLDSSSSSFSPVLFSECLFYLFKNIFKVPIVFLKLYVAVCSVAQQLIDLFSKIIIEKKLKTALCQSNLAFLIGLLEGVIFDHRPTHTQQEYEERKIKAFKDINFCPKYLERIFGSPINEGLTTILEILQNPHYNKQLAYNLIDIVLLEMFPELAGQN
ncbi:sorting nexin-14-like isoform X2 [Sitophilus oryzae]|uniref:Sorting nexin-14-like isoform X2 n=1 Tax=Sitophilus oryzae TaxID=7048 RepID=A0A6J2XHF0_SITOR|nr:sorting nexin-14-like isoform X2 [Sitophilus oryzae]